MNTLTNLLGIEEQESTKVCRKCNKDLPISSFRTRGEGKIQRRIDLDCIICQKREHKIRRDLRKTAPPPPAEPQLGLPPPPPPPPATTK